MTNDLGVWTADDCALVLIDYQKEMFEVRSEPSADLFTESTTFWVMESIRLDLGYGSQVHP
jgi:hypothetical protein